VETHDIEAETAETPLFRGNPQGQKPSKIDRIRRFQFKKGKGANRDPRIRVGGRPRSFQEFRKLVQSIMAETIDVKFRKNGKTLRMTAAEAMVRHAVRSKDPALHRLAFEYAFGKVPDKIEATGLENKTTLILHYAHERVEELADHADHDAPAVNGRPLLRDAD
jgi:hypothetical protein